MRQGRQNPGDNRCSREISITLRGWSTSKLEKECSQHVIHSLFLIRNFPNKFSASQEADLLSPNLVRGLRCLLTISLSEQHARHWARWFVGTLKKGMPHLNGVSYLTGRKYMKKFIYFTSINLHLKARRWMCVCKARSVYYDGVSESYSPYASPMTSFWAHCPYFYVCQVATAGQWGQQASKCRSVKFHLI